MPTATNTTTQENAATQANAWRTFDNGDWQDSIDVRDFIQKNYTPYEGDYAFLKGPTAKTNQLWDELKELLQQEREAGGVLDADTKTVGTVASHGAGYINKDLETVVGVQTDKPLKRAMLPYGGYRIAQKALQAHGRDMDPSTLEIFQKHRKTHNDGVFACYTDEIRKARSAGIVTGLPDGYGRGRIIGDYRRVALYGVDRLIADKQQQIKDSNNEEFTEEWVREREETQDQIQALKDLKTMAAAYGFDISLPAQNGKEAVQWTYFAYLGAVKDQNGAAMSFGRTATFFDVYFERDFAEGTLNEEQAQEIIDHLVMKMRIVRFIRTTDYDELFSGDPTWVTESIGGMGEDGRSLVTKSSFRVLQTLYNLGPAPEPNLTVLWAQELPQGFKDFCAKVSIETSAIQYENDDLMRKYWGDDYGIACCVSAMRIGKQMQFFGARANLAKAMLYAINGGKDEKSGMQVAPESDAFKGDYLEFDDLMARFDNMMEWVAQTYVKALNIIHYMHDKYSPENIMMALHDKVVMRTMACGIAGLSVSADALSAVKYAKVKVIRNDEGLAVDYEVIGDYPAYGNNDDRVDAFANDLVERFMDKVRKQPMYRNAIPTQSVLTITSNVVYGKKTGGTPDGRKAGEPFAPGANPMHGRDKKGAVASMASVAKLPYEHSQDGISYTFSIVPKALGKTQPDQVANLGNILDGYFEESGHHINVNVFEKETLMDAMEHPEKYPQLTVRVSGYAVNFIKLTKEQQMDVITRTFHDNI
ncbi:MULTISPECIES: formate C-acetyltransferase [unclassified Lentimonas]|uniref:formate C-acetyltransferase n=1 Tax=unclassified Lentimonas TaxID=2630993 RepID=UPI0013221763|nr:MULTISPECIES: formate C-acetyltransferase [unclassified Lentimonas]CAA6679557.1 Pyruvate formate-lyase (EC [Lentimonas sp. CC4]CAA6684794.1 Pyruvate formate-lyase (EC [Lentimonas sp. CC6]CAA7075429.1 Pyruvate formate-lyase (EC [Lentimonas sp. CC4]CAA7168908.1 Pyruvate formate-lyase (EC [Lentimonas sp. CC21]CAA7182161.1 Pyruvate formate-lyase (EC [Lentimonas sp. CC8]